MEKATRRRTLTRERVVQAAVELLDEVGLDALSVRKLAEKLEVQVGALYWHIEGKQDLLEAITDRILGEDPLSEDIDADWENLVTEAAHRLRGLLLAHRDGARVLVSTLGLDPNPAEGAEVFLATLRKAGFALERAAYAMDMVVSFVIGSVLAEQSQPTETATFSDVPDERVESVDPARFPNLSEWVSAPHRSRDEVFTAQLGMMLDGLRSELR